MNTIDRVTGPLSEPGAGSRERKKSITQSMGESVFENALRNSEKHEASLDVGYQGAQAMAFEASRVSQKAPESPGLARPSESGSPIAGAARGAAKAPEAAREDTFRAGENSTETSEAPEKGETELRADASPEQEGSAARKTGVGVEDAEKQALQEATSESAAEGSIDISDLEPADQSVADSGADEALQVAVDTPEGEVDISLEEGEAAGGASPQEATLDETGHDGQEFVGRGDDGATPGQPAKSAGVIQQGTTFVETFGRQAFARATSLQQATTAPAPSVDVDSLAEQIASARGTMVGGRARLVIGEGSERVALMVTLRNGVVNVEAKAVDHSLAESMAKSSDELAAALGKHGLSLGNMQTNSDGKSFEPSETSEHQEGTQNSEAVPSVMSPKLRRPGIRVVA